MRIRIIDENGEDYLYPASYFVQSRDEWVDADRNLG